MCFSLFAGHLDWAVSAVNHLLVHVTTVTVYLYFSEVLLLFTVKEFCKMDIKNNNNELLKLKLQELMKLVKHKNH